MRICVLVCVQQLYSCHFLLSTCLPRIYPLVVPRNLRHSTYRNHVTCLHLSPLSFFVSNSHPPSPLSPWGLEGCLIISCLVQANPMTVHSILSGPYDPRTLLPSTPGYFSYLVWVIDYPRIQIFLPGQDGHRIQSIMQPSQPPLYQFCVIKYLFVYFMLCSWCTNSKAAGVHRHLVKQTTSLCDIKYQICPLFGQCD